MDQKGFGGPNGMWWNVMSPGLKIKATNCSALVLNGDVVRAWCRVTARKPVQTPLLLRKSIPNSWSIPRGPNKKLPFTHFHLGGGGGGNHLDKALWIGKFSLTVKPTAFPSALFVNALIVLLGLKIQLAITWVQHVTDYPQELRES